MCVRADQMKITKLYNQQEFNKLSQCGDGGAIGATVEQVAPRGTREPHRAHDAQGAQVHKRGVVGRALSAHSTTPGGAERKCSPNDRNDHKHKTMLAKCIAGQIS